MRRALVLLAAAFALAGAVPDARATDDPAETFRRAELLERGLGDLERAAQLFRDAAAASPTAEARARAQIRAASCLRRLGRAADARALLEPWTAQRDDVPDALRRAAQDEVAALDLPATASTAAPAAGGAASESLAEKERELEEARQKLESVVEKSKGLEAEMTAEMTQLANRVREQDAELARLRAEAQPQGPETAEDVLALRRREMERRRAEAEKLAGTYLKAAQLAYREGRFEEARVFLWYAIERDPGNADAKALLTHVSAPLGDRETLYRNALELVALAREVRSSRRAAQIRYLVDEARQRQARDDFAGSSQPLETALAWLDAAPDLVRGGAALRDEVVRMLQGATAHGVPRAPVAAPADEPGETRWRAALGDLLSDAGREVAQGLDLRFHDLDPVLATSGVPPFPIGDRPDDAPVGWTVSTVGVDAAPLLAAWIRATEEGPLAAPEASVALVGSTCVVLADADVQRRIAQRLSELRVALPGAADVRIGAYRADRGVVSAALASRGVATAALPGGARAASLGPADLAALLEAMPRIATDVVGLAALRATPLRPFRLTAGPATARVVVDALAVPAAVAGGRPGIGLRTAVAWAPKGRAEGAPLTAEALAGAVTAPGGGLVVFGVPDPAQPDADVAVVVRLGAAPPTAGAPLPPPSPNQGADELRVPRVVASVEDPPAPPLLDPEHPVPSRNEALVRRLRDAAPDARLVEVKGERVYVVGPDAARAAVAAALARLGDDARPAVFDVRVHQVAPAFADRVRNLLPRGDRAAGGALSWVVASGKEARDFDALLAAAKGEIPARDTTVAAPPTARADGARMIRTPWRTGVGTTDGGAAWGRSDVTWIDEGLVVSLRPFWRRKDGKVELDVSARARWVAEPGRRDAKTPLGAVPVLDPRTASWWADLSAPLGKGDTLVLFGAASPFAAGGPEHAVVTVRLAE